MSSTPRVSSLALSLSLALVCAACGGKAGDSEAERDPEEAGVSVSGDGFDDQAGRTVYAIIRDRDSGVTLLESSDTVSRVGGAFSLPSVRTIVGHRIEVMALIDMDGDAACSGPDFGLHSQWTQGPGAFFLTLLPQANPGVTCDDIAEWL